MEEVLRVLVSDPPIVRLFKQKSFIRWRKRHDNVVKTLTLTQCDFLPPLPPPTPAAFEKNAGYAPGIDLETCIFRCFF